MSRPTAPSIRSPEAPYTTASRSRRRTGPTHTSTRPTAATCGCKRRRATTRPGSSSTPTAPSIPSRSTTPRTTTGVSLPAAIALGVQLRSPIRTTHPPPTGRFPTARVAGRTSTSVTSTVTPTSARSSWRHSAGPPPPTPSTTPPPQLHGAVRTTTRRIQPRSVSRCCRASRCRMAPHGQCRGTRPRVPPGLTRPGSSEPSARPPAEPSATRGSRSRISRARVSPRRARQSPNRASFPTSRPGRASARALSRTPSAARPGPGPTRSGQGGIP